MSNDSTPNGSVGGMPERPIGITLAATAKAASRAFDDALAEAGGSRPMWLTLLTLKIGHTASQRELADAIGIRGATMTHHLNAMEDDGLVTRVRDPQNRRVHVVELTAKGEEAFHRLRAAAVAFDRKLRKGLTDRDLATLRRLLGQLRDNATAQNPVERE